MKILKLSFFVVFSLILLSAGKGCKSIESSTAKDVPKRIPEDKTESGPSRVFTSLRSVYLHRRGKRRSKDSTKLHFEGKGTFVSCLRPC